MFSAYIQFRIHTFARTHYHNKSRLLLGYFFLFPPLLSSCQTFALTGSLTTRLQVMKDRFDRTVYRFMKKYIIYLHKEVMRLQRILHGYKRHFTAEEGKGHRLHKVHLTISAAYVALSPWTPCWWTGWTLRTWDTPVHPHMWWSGKTSDMLRMCAGTFCASSVRIKNIHNSLLIRCEYVLRSLWNPCRVHHPCSRVLTCTHVSGWVRTHTPKTPGRVKEKKMPLKWSRSLELSLQLSGDSTWLQENIAHG